MVWFSCKLAVIQKVKLACGYLQCDLCTTMQFCSVGVLLYNLRLAAVYTPRVYKDNFPYTDR
jgi:hypothetical protein